MKQADIKAEKPSGDEVEVGQVFLIVAPATPEPPPPPDKMLVALVHDDPAPTHAIGTAQDRESDSAARVVRVDFAIDGSDAENAYAAAELVPHRRIGKRL